MPRPKSLEEEIKISLTVIEGKEDNSWDLP